MDETIKPGLLGQKHSSRDYGKASNWGKNIFNSSFPASLVAYMHARDIKPVYLCVDEDNKLRHTYISGKDLYKIDPLSQKRPTIILRRDSPLSRNTIRATGKK